MVTKTNYFKIGVFVAIGLILTIVGICILGAGQLFRKKVLVETYINQSVQGLDIGSDVRYRGVKIGSVKEIDFVHIAYAGEFKEDSEAPRYVLVRFALQPDAFRPQSAGILTSILKPEIERGLRARLSSEGLTGSLYIEVDYLDPKIYPPLEISWVPDVHYIPSAPSKIDDMLTSVQGILRNVEAIDIDGVIKELRTSITSLTHEIESANLQRVSEQAEKTLADIGELSTTARQLLEREEIQTLLTEAAESARQMRMAAENAQIVSERVAQFMDDETLKESLQNMASVAEMSLGVMQDAQTLVNNMDTMIDQDLKNALKRLATSLQRLDRLVSGQQGNFSQTMENLQRTSRNLEEITRSGREYPSQIILGDPPSRIEFE